MSYLGACQLYPRIASEKEQSIIQLVKAGNCVSEIRKKTGADYRLIKRVIKRSCPRDVEVADKNNKLTDQQKAEVHQLFQNGHNILQIHKRTGIQRKYIRSYKPPPAPKIKWSERNANVKQFKQRIEGANGAGIVAQSLVHEYKKELVRAYLEHNLGVSQKEVSLALGIEHTNVSRIVREIRDTHTLKDSDTILVTVRLPASSESREEYANALFQAQIAMQLAGNIKGSEAVGKLLQMVGE